MQAARLFPLLTACLALSFAATAQQPNPAAAACGSSPANFNVKHQPSTDNATQPPPGKALVYIIESMTHYPFLTKKVNLGLDGAWLGATEDNTHIRFTVDPGVHHLCAVYQGHAYYMDQEGHTLLLRLNAQAGHTYYLRYHAFLMKDTPGIAFFEPVDEDEGPYLVQTTDEATSTLKK